MVRGCTCAEGETGEEEKPMKSNIMSIAILTLLLAACQERVSTDYYTGTDGVVAHFKEGYPPSEVYEGSDIPVIIQFWNKGAASIPLNTINVTLTSDAFYAHTIDASWDREFDSPSDAYLAGKSPAYPNGDMADYKAIVHIKNVTGLREEPSTELFVSYCYPYATTFGTTVCIDSNAFGQNQQRQVCTAQTLTFEDQGAPVAVTSIENRPTPKAVSGGVLTLPVFIIHVENKGTGRVLRPLQPTRAADRTSEQQQAATRRGAAGKSSEANVLDEVAKSLGVQPFTPEETQETCSGGLSGDALHKALNRVAIHATLSGVSLTCNPSTILLHDGKGFTTCTLSPEDARDFSPANYETAFQVELGYVYQESISQEIHIIRREPSITWDAYSGGESGNPAIINGESRCTYCSRNPKSKECQGWSGEKFNESFSCSCGKSECLQLSSSGRCLFGSWCPGTNYCCARPE